MTKTELVELLKDLEWEGQIEAEGDGRGSACPWCGGARLDGGHGEGCELARAIAEGA
jgi:hypothetical protein